MIIDASVATKWFIPEDDSDPAFDLVVEHRLRAPPLLLTEVGNCVYLALAEAEDDVLITADHKFRRKVELSPLARHLVALTG